MVKGFLIRDFRSACPVVSPLGIHRQYFAFCCLVFARLQRRRILDGGCVKNIPFDAQQG